MSEPIRSLFRAGAASTMVEDFRALAEATAPNGAPRYRERPLLEDLARFLVRGSTGANRDAGFYELCHLVNAVDAADAARDRRNRFFMSPEQATARQFRARLDAALAKGGWRRAGFAQTDDGIEIQYPDGRFTVRFSRMPFLAALYEFLAGMESFEFYTELQAILDEMTRAPADIRAIQHASNRVASHYRHYRRRHLAQTQQEGKFDVILRFLIERSPPGRVVIDDAAVLDFWSEKSSSGDFRVYRTVFDAFVNFLRAMDEARHAEAIVRAVPIGTDRAGGEVEPDDSSADTGGAEDWVSPLALLDEEPAAAIKFFKKEGERKPMEFLMHYGPGAVRLPLAFLRLESFGPVQSAITTDLQVGRDRVAGRTSCTEAAPYSGIVAGFEALLTMVQRLQKATFYVLLKNARKPGSASAVIPLREPDSMILFDEARTNIEDGRALPEAEALERMLVEAAKTFRSIARKGFDEAGLADESRIEGFRRGAEALTAVASQIERYVAAARRLVRGERDLEAWFETDRRTFSRKFGMLYGVPR